jgi:serine phosphatase RsbU (regulator of sigma subunit)
MTIDPKTGEYELVNAGHPSPVVVSPEGQIRELQNSENFPLGIVSQEISMERGVLEPQHLVALFTDGLTELTDKDDKELGPERIAEMMREFYLATREKPGLDAMAAKLRGALDGILGNRTPLDDRTFLLARRV